MNKICKLFFSLSGACALFALDNCIKEKVENGTIKNGMIEGTNDFLEIEKHHNKGLPMNKLSNHTKEISVAATMITGGLAYKTVQETMDYGDTATDIANTLILAGALSNTYDRVKRGYVVDYLKLGKKRAIYNISDFFIIFGVIISFFKELRK